jgi:CrcB protein
MGYDAAMLLRFLLVGAAGSLGAMSRYGVDLAVHRLVGREWPWGTLVVNVLGCFALGLLMELALGEHLSRQAALFWTTGFLGAFTTFSTFGFETAQFLEQGKLGLAALNVALQNGTGVLAVFAGAGLGGRLFAG